MLQKRSSAVKLMLIPRMFFYGSQQHIPSDVRLLRMFLQHIDAIINAFTLPLAGICRISPLESFSLSLLFLLSPFFFLKKNPHALFSSARC